MAFKTVKKLLGTAIILSMITSKTNTGVSVSFPNWENNNPSVQNTKELVKNIGDEVDKSNLLDKTELKILIEKIKSFANKFTKEENVGDFEKVSMVRVVDGDTIVVDIEGDSCGNKEHEATVRLIGVNTPESVASEEYLEKTGKENTAEGKAASEFTTSLLDNYEFVYLESDEEDKDKYGRLLRYVWIESPTNTLDLAEISTDMLNGILLKEGYAEVATYYPNDKYENYFIEIAAEDYEESIER